MLMQYVPAAGEARVGHGLGWRWGSDLGLGHLGLGLLRLGQASGRVGTQAAPLPSYPASQPQLQLP